MLLFSMVENEKDLSKFQRIYDQYKNMMYWVAYDITKNTHDAEDVVVSYRITCNNGNQRPLINP